MRNYKFFKGDKIENKKTLKATSFVSQGFTLIELLVVIAIVGIMAVVILVNLSHVRDRARISAFKEEVLTAQRSALIKCYTLNTLPTPLEEAGTFMPEWSADSGYSCGYAGKGTFTASVTYSDCTANISGSGVTFVGTGCI